MSSLFEVPAQLVLILSLAASGAGEAPPVDVSKPTSGVVATGEGPMAFSEQAWLEALKSGAGGEVLATEAGRIFRTGSGRYYVPSENDRQRILALRRNQNSAAVVALAMATHNSGQLKAAIDRAPTAGELYMAHALGSETAISLIKAAEANAMEPLSGRFNDVLSPHPELRDTSGRPLAVAAAVSRLKEALDRRPNGAEVATWFSRGPGFALSGDIKGRITDETAASGGIEWPHRAASMQDWETVVSASP